MNWLKKLKFHNMKVRHWVLLALLLLIILTKMNLRWGLTYTFFIYPHIASCLSHVSGIFPFAIGDIFIALSIAWVILYPIYELFIRKTLIKKGIIKKGWFQQGPHVLKKENCVWKSCGILAMGVRLVLYHLGAELLPTQRFRSHRNGTSRGFKARFKSFRQ